jgi:small GTP-binding protein
MVMKFAFKIILIGPSAVGKTSIINRYVKNQFTDYKPTLGVDFLLKEVKLDDKLSKLSIWDIGGHEKFKTLRNSYYQGATGTLLIFDLTRRKTYDEMENWYAEMVEILGRKIPFLLIGNKVDLIKKKNGPIPDELVEKFVSSHESTYIKTSAKTGKNVEEAFEELVIQMMEAKKEDPKAEVSFF